MKYFKTIILGSGASGVMCGLSIKNKKDVAIIDKNAKLAKKILVTGNGRCNLTNLHIFKNSYNQDVTPFINRFNQNDLLAFFSSLGLMTYADEEGRVYPISNSAKSVVDVLTNALNKTEINQIFNENILKIEKKNDIFEILTENNSYSCKNLVVCLGGKSCELLDKNFKLSISPLTPSLVSLKANVSRSLAGVRVNARVYLINEKGEQSQKETGEVLFRENGLSGICIFNQSAFLARNKDFNGEIFLNLMPNFNEEEIKNILKERRNLNIQVSSFFDGMFAKELGWEILTRSKVNEQKQSILLSDDEIKRFCQIIKHLNFKIKGYLENNQVFSGGIKLDSLNENLMSKSTNNLYFCGEGVDVDGLCGGYNLQWAFTSGKIVGENLW